MCTVSYVYLNNQFFFTSNRDEKTSRLNAIPPQNYNINQQEVYFPKDAQAGGTWFAATQKSVIILLNGAEEKHQIKPKYNRSRGLVVLELFTEKPIIENWNHINLNEVEPFTLVVFENQKLYQLQWNEIEKNKILLNNTQSYIWSSSTLYSLKVKKLREKMFAEFLENNEITSESIIKFHQINESFDTENNIIFNLQENLKTVSITQVVINQEFKTISYLDLKENKSYFENLNS